MWQSFSYPTKFSIIACGVTAALGLLSIGLLGGLLYYPVSFVLKKYPSLSEWHGDWVWPATIGVGMGWSLAFLFGGLSWHYLAKFTDSRIALYAVYIFILWAWAAILWYFTVKSNF